MGFKPIKFLCSYGGRILPRYPDGKLRYHGGETRVLSVDTSISFAELLVKMGEMCGSPVSLRCQLPTEDLDALVSITSDEDLANLIEEYHHAASAADPPPPSFKIRAFLSAPKRASPPPSSASSLKSPYYFGGVPPRYPSSVTHAHRQRSPRPPAYPVFSRKFAGRIPRQFWYQNYNGQGNGCGLSSHPQRQPLAIAGKSLAIAKGILEDNGFC